MTVQKSRGRTVMRSLMHAVLTWVKRNFCFKTVSKRAQVGPDGVMG